VAAGAEGSVTLIGLCDSMMWQCISHGQQPPDLSEQQSGDGSPIRLFCPLEARCLSALAAPSRLRATLRLC
jgi:hypothetical protein